MSDAISAGFDDPVFGSQSVFRKILKSMSEPGIVSIIDYNLDEKPEALNLASYAIALTLFDHDTSVYLTESLNQQSIKSSLGFHCSTKFDESYAESDFILCDESEIPMLSELNLGNEEYPDQSCTVVIQVERIHSESFSEKVGRCLLTGAGIENKREIASTGLTPELIEQRHDLMKLFPLGVDLIFCAGNEFFCLPRTTNVKQIPNTGEA